MGAYLVTSSNYYGTDASSVTVSIPTQRQAGDLILLAVSHVSQNTVVPTASTPSGFTAAVQHSDGMASSTYGLAANFFSKTSDGFETSVSWPSSSFQGLAPIRITVMILRSTTGSQLYVKELMKNRFQVEGNYTSSTVGSDVYNGVTSGELYIACITSNKHPQTFSNAYFQGCTGNAIVNNSSSTSTYSLHQFVQIDSPTSIGQGIYNYYFSASAAWRGTLAGVTITEVNPGGGGGGGTTVIEETLPEGVLVATGEASTLSAPGWVEAINFDALEVADLQALDMDFNTYSGGGAFHELPVGTTSNVLRATNFGFTSLPSDATILGISVFIGKGEYGYSVPSLVRDQKVQLVNSGTNIGSNKAKISEAWEGQMLVMSYSRYGTDFDDLWGITPTVSMVKGSTFGIDFQVANPSGSADISSAMVDHIQMRIYYSEAGGGDPPPDPPVNTTSTVTTTWI